MSPSLSKRIGGLWVPATGGPTHFRGAGSWEPLSNAAGPIELLTEWGADTFEEPGAGWTPNGCTVERTQEDARTGSWSAKITTTTTGTSSLYVPNDGLHGAWAVTPEDHGSVWRINCWVKAATAARPLDLYLRFLNVDESGTPVSIAYQFRYRLTEGNANFSAVVGEWVQMSLQGTLTYDFYASVGAIDAVLWIDPAATGEVYYLDDASVTRENIAMPPLPPPQPGLRLPGLATDWLETPDTPATSTYQYDLRIKVTLDLPLATSQSFLTKVGTPTSDIAWIFRLDSNGGLVLRHGESGAGTSQRSVSGFSLPRGEPYWFRASRDAQGDVWLGISADNVEWSELEQTSPYGMGQYDSSGPVAIGRALDTVSVHNTGPLKGIVHYAEVRDARDGNVVHTFDAESMAAMANGPQDTSMLEDGGPWTIHGSDWEWVT